jgi:hypothetical protein
MAQNLKLVRRGKVQLKIAIIFLISFFISFSAMAQTTELPEPTMPPINYEYEIGWGSKPVVAWSTIVPTSITFVDGMVSVTHVYNGVLGDNKFEFMAVDSTIAIPKKAIIVLNVATVPSGKLFDIFRIRVRASTTFDGQMMTSAWSEPSFWVLLLNFKVFNQPVSIR